MDYRFRPEEEAFRQEVRSFLTSELPPEWDYDPFELFDEVWEFAKGFTKKLAQKGWIAPAWPKEYGGEDLPFMKQVVLSEELAYYRAPNTGYIGVTYAGPTMIVYGTEEQKKEFIPGILSGDIIWCQGYSEPNAGSDLASLEMRAVRDGDDYVINGTKIWSSNAHKANWCFLLARTDMDAPKHKGISYFVTPMDTPGISVRPLVNMADEHVFNEILFDNVRIPARYRVGEENRGWYIGMTTLDFERSNISSAAAYRRTLEMLTDYVKEHGTGNKEQGSGADLGKDRDATRMALADLAVGNEVGRYLSYRVANMQERGQIPNYESSAAKVYHSEYAQKLSGLGLNIMGMFGQLREGSPYARLRGRFARTYVTSVGITIAAGTSEVQRNIIANRGLGLSRG
jgi:alkylation response protein AidB-like acyl-CoA dehydrogenase